MAGKQQGPERIDHGRGLRREPSHVLGRSGSPNAVATNACAYSCRSRAISRPVGEVQRRSRRSASSPLRRSPLPIHASSPAGERDAREPRRWRSEDVGNGRSQVRERRARPEVDRPGRAGARRQHRNVLPRVIGGHVRGIAAVVPGHEQEPAPGLATARRSGRPPRDLRQAAVEGLDGRRVAGRVVAVPVLRVEVDQVGEHERRARAARGRSSVRSIPSSFESEYRHSVSPWPSKMSRILPTP